MSYYVVCLELDIFDEFDDVNEALDAIYDYMNEYQSDLDDYVLIKGDELLLKHGRVELRDE